MGRYRLSHIALLLVVAGVAAATCGVSPALEQLQQRVAELEAESDAQLVAGNCLGPLVMMWKFCSTSGIRGGSQANGPIPGIRCFPEDCRW
jgi:hypothetical protein